MQRSDISNINKLFLESTLEKFYVTDWEEVYNPDGSHVPNYNRVDVNSKTASSIQEIAVYILEDMVEHHYNVDIDIYDMWASPDYILINTTPGPDCFSLVSRYIVSDADEIERSLCIKEYSVTPSEFLARFKYKQTATKGIDPDLGFGDLFDVL